ncbi:MAG: hypothetical protein ABW215_15290 [Kibdelosporangium sp.]
MHDHSPRYGALGRNTEQIRCTQIDKPLDATQVLPRPCSACRWQSVSPGLGLGVSFTTGKGNGLAVACRNHELGTFPDYWIGTTVDGYAGCSKMSPTNALAPTA